MPWYTITEPHPSVPKNTWTHSGRGGAGNHFRAPATTSPSGVATAVVAAAATAAAVPPVGRFYSGRGGAGNAHAASKRPVLDFDEEYRQAAVRDHASGHVGRGGAGNVFRGPVVAVAVADPSEPRGSTSSNGTNFSELSRLWGRLSLAAR